MTIRRVGAACAFLLCGAASAQTTQGLISGRLENSQTGGPVAGATITYSNAATAIVGAARSDSDGYYFLPLLSPGFYRVRAAADGFQPREVQELELPVAGRIELNFPLRPLNDVWEAGQYRSVRLPGSKTIVTFYGPDVDSSRSGSFEAAKGRRGTLESTVSQVIDPLQVRDLPLAGRDVYTMLVTQPGVTADNGTARGLGLSINGQRPSSSNFMLDGLENNNYLITGPLTAIAPEAVQEYRVSTNNFSAAYGRTAGFVANAVSKSGGSEFHGIGYYYLKNEALNANGFQENLAGLKRLKARENQFGGQVGGPVVKERLFFSGAVERLRSRGAQQMVTLELPTPLFNTVFPDAIRASRRLLDQFPSPAAGNGRNLTQLMAFNPPVTVDRILSIGRLDYTSKSGADRVMGRVSINRLSRPDFIWTPYKDFVSGLDQNTFGVAVSHLRTIRPNLLNEAKIGRTGDDLGWNRPHPEIPTILVAGQLSSSIEMPGSPAFYEYQNNNKSWEFLDNLVWTNGRHVYTFGGGFLLRTSDGFLTAGRDGEYRFDGGLLAFGQDRPNQFRTTVTRAAFPGLKPPAFDQSYRYKQYFLFAQDTFKATSRLALNYGVRYENYGAPRNSGSTKDLILLYEGKTPTFRYPQGRGHQQLYPSDNNDWAGRFGFSYDLRGNGRTLLRGAYGIFYDRPFDNLWQNIRGNDYTLPPFTITARSFDFLQPVASVLPQFVSQADGAALENFPDMTGFDTNFRSAYTQSYFLGVQQQLTDNWSVEVNGAGSLGRKLIVTDRKNRRREEIGGSHAIRSSMGLSNYQALTTSVRYRGSRSQFQLAYTWSHAIDHQSDALTGEFFDLLFVKVGGGSREGLPALTLEGDLRRDRGNADFDQRHNLVFLSVWDLPRALQETKARWLFRDWKFSQLAAFRSGFPVYVRAPAGFAFTDVVPYNNRPNLLNPAQAVLDAPQSVVGGKRLYRLAAFGEPADGAAGNVGRNAFRGPGLYNIDLSLARSFPLRWLGESGRVMVRADAFNFLNHANLGNPDALITSPDFGVARYGRSGAASGFPAVAPLNETARQIQMILRIEF